MNDPADQVAARAALRASEETLWQTHKMIALGHLAGGVAHQFNNLMQGVIASLEVMRKMIRGGRASEAESLIARAIASAQQASLLNQHLARFVRQQPIAPAPLSLNAVVADVADMLRQSMSGAFALDIAPASQLWTTYCDASQAEIAILDMVILARDSMPGGGTIVIATRNDEGVGDVGSGQPAPQFVCIAVAARGAAGGREALDPGATRQRPAGEGSSADAQDMVARFARTYGGEVRRSADASMHWATEVCLPRFAVES